MPHYYSLNWLQPVSMKFIRFLQIILIFRLITRGKVTNNFTIHSLANHIKVKVKVNIDLYSTSS